MSAVQGEREAGQDREVCVRLDALQTTNAERCESVAPISVSVDSTTATAEKPEYLTVAEVSTLFRVSVPTIYRRVADGQLPHIRIGNDGPIRIPADELKRWL